MSTLGKLWQQSFWWLIGLHLANSVIALLSIESARFKAAFFKWPAFAQNLLPVILYRAVPGAPACTACSERGGCERFESRNVTRELIEKRIGTPVPPEDYQRFILQYERRDFLGT